MTPAHRPEKGGEGNPPGFRLEAWGDFFLLAAGNGAGVAAPHTLASPVELLPVGQQPTLQVPGNTCRVAVKFASSPV